MLDLLVDERAQLGEGDDVVEAPTDLALRKPRQAGVAVDVVAPGELTVEPSAELRRDATRPRTVTAPRVGATMTAAATTITQVTVGER
jgi:hypothetical protein